LQSAFTLAAPVLAQYGYPGVDYAITGCLGMVSTPNGCAASADREYLTEDMLAGLQSTYGWEIGSHTKTHPQLSTDRLDGTITLQQMLDEIDDSKTILSGDGFAAADFADPYGDYDNTSLTAIAQTYASHRGFADIGSNSYPYNDYLLTVQQIQGNVSVAEAEGYIDAAQAAGQWLILVFHEIKSSGASTALDDYEYNVADLGSLAAYVHAQGIPVTDIAHGLAVSSDNLFANGGFDDGIADGWTTDDATGIVADANSNGSYDGSATGAVNSISLRGAAADTHLFSPTIAIESSQRYLLKSFVHVVSTSGEIDFYIDEYDATGTWSSGQYVQGVTGTPSGNTIAVKDVNFAYTPSSAQVATIRYQVIVHGATTEAYVDNIQMFPTSSIGNATPPSSCAP
jgi:peptidoglycan/xylan/chitin deacetylase (PgdA/CDA1 family)